MDYFGRSTTLVQVIYILRDDVNVKKSLQLCKQFMRRIGFYFVQLSFSCVIKIQNQLRVSGKTFWGSHIFNAMILPKSIVTPKSFYSAFCRNSCTGKDNQFFHSNLKFSLNITNFLWLMFPMYY